MTNQPAAIHLKTLKDIAFRRTPLSDCAEYCEMPRSWTWQNVLDTAQALQLADGSPAVSSMRYGVKEMPAGTFGTYTGATRHIDIATGYLNERSLATSLHEMAHALLHSDVSEQCYADNEAWLEAEADVVADLVLMQLGFGPRRATQWTLTNMGNVGDVAAFFHFAGDTLIAAAHTIYTAWRRACYVAPLQLVA